MLWSGPSLRKRIQRAVQRRPRRVMLRESGEVRLVTNGIWREKPGEPAATGSSRRRRLPASALCSAVKPGLR